MGGADGEFGQTVMVKRAEKTLTAAPTLPSHWANCSRKTGSAKPGIKCVPVDTNVGVPASSQNSPKVIG